MPTRRAIAMHLARVFTLAFLVATISVGLSQSPSLARSPRDPVLPPRPYDPAIDGPARPDSTAHLNLVGRGIQLPNLAADRAKRSFPSQDPGDGELGFWIPTGLSIDGTYAGHDVNTDISVPFGVTWYAPTMIPPDINNPSHIACVETVTIHRWNFGTEHAWGLWDHCINNNWFVYKKMDGAFLGTYTRTFDGELRYFTQVVKDSPTSWAGYLYNFNWGAWEYQGSIVGGTTKCCWPGGWTAWESYGTAGAGCPDSKSIRAAPVQVRFTSRAWSNLTPSYSSNLLTTNACVTSHYRITVNQPNYDWVVNYYP